METHSKKRAEFIPRLGAVCFWLALWAVLAVYVGNDLLLAGPAATTEAFAQLLERPEFWSAIALSGGRIVGSACASAIVGIVLGLAAAKWRALEVLLEIPLQIMKSAPVACVIVILLVACGSSGAIVIIVAFVALPPFYIASLEAAHFGAAKNSVENSVENAAENSANDESRALEIMGLSRLGIFLACTWPAILPLYKHAAKTAVALSWRAGITGELLSIPLGSMGAGIYASKLTLDTPALLAWTIVVMLLAFLCEAIVLGLLSASESSPKLALKMRKSISKKIDAKDATLKAQSVFKAYEGHQVLENVSLCVSTGEEMLLTTPTGSGKTTLLRVILGLEYPDSGSTSHPSLCGLVLQSSTLVPNLSAWENVLLVADANRNVDEMRACLETLLPENTLDKKARQLSGGTKRLTEIARALYSPGSAIVLDEPFAGLDQESHKRARAFIQENLHDRPLIIATHEHSGTTAT